MIKLCERCFASADGDENVVRLAHIDAADAHGGISWIYTYVHTAGCAVPRVPDHQRPDTGSWDAGRGIASRRQP